MCDLKPGDEVVCVTVGHIGPVEILEVNGYKWRATEPPSGIQGGMVYTVSHVGIGASGRVVVWLKDARNYNKRGYDIGYNPLRFRKVTKSKTDIQAWLAQPSDFEEPKRDKVKT